MYRENVTVSPFQHNLDYVRQVQKFSLTACDLNDPPALQMSSKLSERNRFPRVLTRVSVFVLMVFGRRDTLFYLFLNYS